MKKYYDCNCNEDFDNCRKFSTRDIESVECLKCSCDRRGKHDGYNGKCNGENGGYDGDYYYDDDNGNSNCGGCQRRFKFSLKHLIGVTVRLFIMNETVITGIILCVMGDEVKVLERESDRVILIREKDIAYVEEPRFFPQF